MSANETIHVSATGGQKAGNDERYDLIPTDALRRLAVHAGTVAYGAGGSFHRMMAHAWAFWAGATTEFATQWEHLPAAAFEAFRIVDSWRPPTWVLDDRRPGDARYDRIPPDALRQLARHFGVGAKKYADDNWRRGYDWRLTFAAACRHAEQYRAGETHDPETGSHHLIAFAWHMLVLDEFTRIHPQFDTRTSTKLRQWLDAERLYVRNPETVENLAEAEHWASTALYDGPLADWERELLADSGHPAKPIDGCVQQDPRCPSLCLACDRVRPPRVVHCRGLGDAEKNAEWTDQCGDRWRYHLPGAGMGTWQIFCPLTTGKWENSFPHEDYGPYTEVPQPAEPEAARPSVVKQLTESEKDAEWIGKLGRYRWDNECGRWLRHHPTIDFWFPTVCTSHIHGPYTEHHPQGDDE
jgi:hypothetical protein